MDLREQLINYKPFNEQEEKDRDLILFCLDHFDDLYTRDNKTAHLTASAWVTDQTHTKILMAYHNLYDSWSWLGGHADGETDLLQTALREVREESGIQSVRPLLNEIFSVEILNVDGHEKRGEYVSSHLHLNVTFLLEADADEQVHIRQDENSGVKWFMPDEAVRASSEPWFRERIYSKLNKKMREVIHE